MSTSRSAGGFVIPWSYRTYRATILLVFLLILLLVVLGAAGHGPVRALHQPTSQGISWVKRSIGIKEPVKTEVIKKAEKPKKSKSTKTDKQNETEKKHKKAGN